MPTVKRYYCALLLVATCLSPANESDTLRYNLSEQEAQFTAVIQMPDPACPGEPDKSFRVKVITGRDGLPMEYAMQVDVHVGNWMNQRIVKGILFWDLAGGYKRFVPDDQHPLRKNTKEPFSEADYQELDEILNNSNSMLGNPGLNYLARPEQTDPAPDGISAATPKTLQRASVENAVWTSWIVWQYANGETVERLKALTRERRTPALLKHMLTSENLNENAYALNILRELHLGEEQFVPAVLVALQQGEFSNIGMALHFLEETITDETELFDAVIDACSDMIPGYIPMIVRFLANKPSAGEEHLAKLSHILDELPYYPLCSILDLLEKRAVFSEDVLVHVDRLLESDSERIAHRAKQFIEARDIHLKQ